MHSLINKLLKKRGIEDVANLSEEEQKMVDTWIETLSAGDTLSVDSLRDFLGSQVGSIESKWRDPSLDLNTCKFLVSQHVVYKSILEALDAPKFRREALEKELNRMVKA